MRFVLFTLALVACLKPIDNDGDEFDNNVDCNDYDPAVNPSATEVCNGIDDDCSLVIDDAATDAPSFFADTDGDGFGDPTAATSACVAPAGYVSTNTDCDDTNPAFNPGAIEADCTDPTDYNCDGSAGAIDLDKDGFFACEDCDDGDADSNPDAVELCDGKDNDCDRAVDEDAENAPTWYLDIDGDAWGADRVTVDACEAPAGYTDRPGDCNDVDERFHPDASEADCTDPNDYNCDGSVGYADADGDGFAACEDCDDKDDHISPVGVEICDGDDNDCDGFSDIDAIDEVTYYKDTDKDGYGTSATSTTGCSAPSGYTTTSTDCDDGDATIYPSAPETCDDDDDDCDGSIDEDATDAATWFADLDGDGAYGSVISIEDCEAPSGYGATATDCDDLDGTSYPSASEVCDDVDNDCDGSTDESATDMTTWYYDGDADKFGLSSKSSKACDQPSGYVADKTDCDDSSSYIHPGALEFCDTKDNDCDGTADESDAYDATKWYADADKDGYGNAGSAASTACKAPTGYVDNDDDCNDGKATISPDATEFCNSVDDNCDGVTDGSDAADAEVYYPDSDGDGYGDPTSPSTACALPSGYTTDDSDCEDADADAYPDSREEETPNDGVDQDCDGNDYCTDLDCDGLPDLMFFSYHDGDYYTTAQGYYTGGDTAFASADRWDFVSYSQVYGEVDDINQDGYQDIVLPVYCADASCSSRSGKSSIYWGSASGYSSSDRTQLSTVGVYGTCIGDIDDDGYKDVVFASHYTGSSYSTTSIIFWGSAAGWSDSDKTSLPTDGAEQCSIEDFDNDGDQDVFFQSYYDGDYSTNSRVYWNTSGAFASTDYDALPGYGTEDHDIADYNNDGYLDVVLGDYYDGDYYATSYVYYGSSTGYSTSSRNALTMYGIQEVRSADLNGDGYLDLVFAGYYDGDYYVSSWVYWGSATGFTDSSRQNLDNYGSLDVEIVDLDGDGYLDILFGQHYDGDYYVNQTTWFGSKTGYSSSNTMSLVAYGVESMSVADFDHDGYNDILYDSYYDGDYSANAYLYWGSAKGWSSSSLSTLPTYGSIDHRVVGK